MVARLLGLRTNHPAAQDALELRPNDPATRAEAAYSAAQILRFDEWRTQSLADAAATFELPVYTPMQTKILHTAVSLIGFPYVWGGTSEGPQAPFGVQATRRLRLLGLRLERLQAPRLRRRTVPRRSPPRQDDHGDERRGAEKAPNPV